MRNKRNQLTVFSLPAMTKSFYTQSRQLGICITNKQQSTVKDLTENAFHKNNYRKHTNRQTQRPY